MNWAVGQVYLTVQEQSAVAALDGSNELANGSIRWWPSDKGGKYSIVLWSSIDYVLHVQRLAASGSLPNLLLQFKKGHGIDFPSLAPDRTWDNVNAERVPIHQFQLIYTFFPNTKDATEKDDDDDDDEDEQLDAE